MRNELSRIRQREVIAYAHAHPEVRLTDVCIKHGMAPGSNANLSRWLAAAGGRPRKRGFGSKAYGDRPVPPRKLAPHMDEVRAMLEAGVTFAMIAETFGCNICTARTFAWKVLGIRNLKRKNS